MTDKSVKPQLHQSHLSGLYRCGYKFSRVVLEGEREPATIPLVMGLSTHATVAKNLTNVIEKGSLFTKEAMQDYAKDDFMKEWNEASIVLNELEIEQGLDKTKDYAQDATIRLVTAHHYELAPQIKPKQVERKWVLVANGYDYDLAGTIDIDEGIDIRDTKTRKTNLGQREVDCSEQYTFYALAKYMVDGKLPEFVHQDNIIKPTERRGAYCTTYKSTRTQDDFTVVMRRFDQATKIIKSGVFAPANPSDWWCSKSFCGFAADGTCPFFNSKGRKEYKRVVKEGVKNNGRRNEGSIINQLESALKSNG